VGRSPYVALALMLAGCSLMTPSRDRCDSSAECRSTFGAGFYCAPDNGLCESSLSPICPEIYPATAADDPEAIVFGTIFDRSSPNQQARGLAARLAVDGLNERSGIDGRPVALLECDSREGMAGMAADRLVEVGVTNLIGPSASSDVESVFQRHREAGIFIVSPAATAATLADIDTRRPGRLWRTAPPDDLQALAVEDALRAESITTISVIAKQNDTYAQGLSLRVRDLAGPAGITVVESVAYATPDDIASAATDALGASAPPETVIFLSSQVAEAAAFLDATASISGYDGVSILFTDAAANGDLFVMTTDGAARFGQVFATRPSAPDTIVTEEFDSNFEAAFGDSPFPFSFAAHTYDATVLVLLGAGFSLGDRGEVTADGIAQGILRMSNIGQAETRLVGTSFIPVIEQIRASGDTVNVVGASGPLDFDPTTEELTSATYDLLSISGMSFAIDRTITVPPP